MKLDYKILKPVFDNIGKVYKDLGSMFDIYYRGCYDHERAFDAGHFEVAYRLLNGDITECLKDGKIDSGDIVGFMRYFKNSIHDYIKRNIPTLYKYRCRYDDADYMFINASIAKEDSFYIDICFTLFYGEYPYYRESY